MRAALAALSLALLSAACDPIGEVRFIVVSTAGVPVAAARVAITCPDSHVPTTYQQSDPDGLVLYHRIPDIDPACTFTIEKPGFATKSLPREGVGYHQGIKQTLPPVKVVLDPAPPAPAAPETGAATPAPSAGPFATPPPAAPSAPAKAPGAGAP